MSFQGNCTNIFIMQENIWKYFSTNLLKRRNFPLSGSSVVWCCAVERYCCWVVSTAQRTSPRPGPSEYVWVMAGPITPRWTLDIPCTQLTRVPQFSHFILYQQYSFYLLAECTLEISQLRSLWKRPTNHQLPLKASVQIASGDNLLKCPFMRKSVQKVLKGCASKLFKQGDGTTGHHLL